MLLVLKIGDRFVKGGSTFKYSIFVHAYLRSKSAWCKYIDKKAVKIRVAGAYVRFAAALSKGM